MKTKNNKQQSAASESQVHGFSIFWIQFPKEQNTFRAIKWHYLLSRGRVKNLFLQSAAIIGPLSYIYPWGSFTISVLGQHLGSLHMGLKGGVIRMQRKGLSDSHLGNNDTSGNRLDGFPRSAHENTKIINTTILKMHTKHMWSDGLYWYVGISGSCEINHKSSLWLNISQKYMQRVLRTKHY